MSEPLFQHIYLGTDQSYNILKVDRPHFVVPWHMHPEIEIMSIIKGEGSRFIGDSIGNFEAGDLVMVGSNVPHYWKNSLKYYESNSKLRAQARVILFREECFGHGFFKTAELKNIKDLMSRAQRGICFTGKSAGSVSQKISKAYTQHGVRRLISFIDILNDLAESNDFRHLSSADYKPSMFADDMNRLNKVIDFLTKNFQKPLTLEQIAAEAYMSPTAFCRYFKEHTNKTVIRFVNELRVSYAKKLLAHDRSNVSDIHYDCGFPNASNFYEQFNKIAGCSPLKFRKQQEGRLL